MSILAECLERRKKIIELYHAGKYQSEIARDVNVSRQYVHQVLKEAGQIK